MYTQNPFGESFCSPHKSYPWTEKLGGLQSTGSKRVRHDLMTKQHQQIFNSALGGVIRFSWGSKCSIIKMNCNWSPANGYM